MTDYSDAITKEVEPTADPVDVDPTNHLPLEDPMVREEYEAFQEMPKIEEGHSKDIRLAEERDGKRDLAWIFFKPTIYSYTANRAAIVEDSGILRLRTAEAFAEVVEDAGLNHAYEGRTESGYFMKTEVIEQPPPIETVVKQYHIGTPKHRYYGMDGSHVRDSHPAFAGEEIEVSESYPSKIVRFDWRNPLKDPESGDRMADEPLPRDIADWYLDTEEARETVLKAWDAIHDFLAKQRVMMYDVCFFVDQYGDTIYGEISQDCGRFRHFDYGMLDKDVWRAGGSSDRVLEKWDHLADIVEEARS